MKWVNPELAGQFGLDTLYQKMEVAREKEQSHPQCLPEGEEIDNLQFDCTAIQTAKEARKWRQQLYVFQQVYQDRLGRLKAEKQKSAQKPNPYSLRRETLKAQLEYIRVCIQLLDHLSKVAPSGQT